MTLLCELWLRWLWRRRLLILSILLLLLLLLLLRQMMMMTLLCRLRGKHLRLRTAHHLRTPHPGVMTALVLILLLPRPLILLLVRPRLLHKGRPDHHRSWNRVTRER